MNVTRSLIYLPDLSSGNQPIKRIGFQLRNAFHFPFLERDRQSSAHSEEAIHKPRFIRRIAAIAASHCSLELSSGSKGSCHLLDLSCTTELVALAGAKAASISAIRRSSSDASRHWRMAARSWRADLHQRRPRRHVEPVCTAARVPRWAGGPMGPVQGYPRPPPRFNSAAGGFGRRVWCGGKNLGTVGLPISLIEQRTRQPAKGAGGSILCPRSVRVSKTNLNRVRQGFVIQGFRGRWKRRCILHSRKGHFVERSTVA